MPKPNETDKSVDAVKAAADEKAVDAISLSEEETLRRLGGVPDVPEPDVEDSSSDAEADSTASRAHPDPTQPEDSPLAEEDSSSEPDADSTQSKQDESESKDSTAKEESTPSIDQDEPVFIGLDDGDALTLHAPTPAPTPAQDAAAPNLTTDERVRLWQSKADQATTKLAQKEQELATAVQTIEELRAQTAQSAHAPKAFDKKPQSFLEQGEEWIQDDQYDPSTPSGQAMRNYLDARAQHDREQLKAEIRAERQAEDAHKAEETSAMEAVKYLRTKRPKDYQTDDAVAELVTWSKTVGPRGLYILSVARDLVNGRLPLSRSVLQKALAVAGPSTKGGNGKSVVTMPEAPASPAKVVEDSDSKVLKRYFADVR